MSKGQNLSHIDEEGRAGMVDVGHKAVSQRWARAQSEIHLSAEALALVDQADQKASDFRAVVETAGMMAAKRTSELVPHCHPLPLSHIDVNLSLQAEPPALIVEAVVKTTASTGVEMEAMTAVSVAALTVYDMIKAVDPAAVIRSTRLLEKHGGSSGDLVLDN